MNVKNTINKLGVLGFIAIITLLGTGLGSILNLLSNNLILQGMNIDTPILINLTGITGTMNTSYTLNNGVITFIGESYGGESLLLNASMKNRANNTLNGTFKIELAGTNITGGEFSQAQVRFYNNSVWSNWEDVTSVFNASPYTLSRNFTWMQHEELKTDFNINWSTLIQNGSYNIGMRVIPN
jgi:hypothetical protein